MAQALFLAAVYAAFVLYDVSLMKREKSPKKSVVLYIALVGFCVVVTMLFFLHVDLMDPQKAIVDLMTGMGLS